jgi:hypothetical protein
MKPALNLAAVPRRVHRASGPGISGQRAGEKPVLVYRNIPHRPDWLAFAEANRAQKIHLIWTAINCAGTWGEFIDRLPAGEWRSLCRLWDDERPRRKERFNAEQLPGFSDGDYPPWLQTEMGRVLPAIIAEEFGLHQQSVINGTYWDIPAELEQPIVERLVHLGYSVTRRDDWHFY